MDHEAHWPITHCPTGSDPSAPNSAQQPAGSRGAAYTGDEGSSALPRKNSITKISSHIVRSQSTLFWLPPGCGRLSHEPTTAGAWSSSRQLWWLCLCLRPHAVLGIQPFLLPTPSPFTINLYVQPFFSKIPFLIFQWVITEKRNLTLHMLRGLGHGSPEVEPRLLVCVHRAAGWPQHSRQGPKPALLWGAPTGAPDGSGSCSPLLGALTANLEP